MNKKMFKNSVYNVVYRIINIIFPFVVSIYVARILKAEKVGMVAAAQNNVKYFTMLAALGIPTYGVKLLAQYEVRSEKSSKSFYELFIINGILSLLSFLIYILVLNVVPYFEDRSSLYVIVGMVIIFNIINIDWFFQGIQEYGYIALRNCVVKLVSTVAIVVFVKCEEDFLIYAGICTIAQVGNYFFNLFKIIDYVIPVTEGLQFKSHLKHILLLFISSVAVEIYVLADMTMLDVMCSPEIVGYYTMSLRAITLMRSIAVAISAVFLPQMSYLYYSGKGEEFTKLVSEGMHILCLISVPVAIGIMLVADDAIILAFGEAFKSSIWATRILSLSIVTVSISNYIGLQVLVTLGREKITTISTVCGAIVNIIMNFFLISSYQHNGAAIASAATEVVVTCIQVILSSRYIKIKYCINSVLASCTIMAMCVVGVKLLVRVQILRLLLAIVVGCFVYVLALYHTGDSIALMIMKRMKKQN